MRTNSTFTTGVNNAILSAAPRKVDCRVKIRDDRLRFSEYANAINADKFLAMSGDNGYETHDAYLGGAGRLTRVAAKIIDAQWTLVYQWSFPPDQTWPDWTNTGLALRPNTKPGVYGNNIWYCGADNEVHIAETNSNTGAITDNVIGWNGNSPISEGCKLAFAPVSSTDCYIHIIYPGSDTSLARLRFFRVTSTYDSGTQTSTFAFNSQHDWNGVVHCDEEEWGSFDAVRFDSTDYIYMSINAGRRAMCITATVQGAAFSEPQDIFPLDYSDDIAKMIIGGVSVLNNKVFISGTLTRSENGQPMQVYTMGPEHYTAGRDMFIGPVATSAFIKEIDDEDYFFRAGQGILLTYGNQIYFIVPGATRVAQTPTWMGGGPAVWTYTCNNMSLSYGADGSGALTLDVPASLDTAILPGMTLLLETYLVSGGYGTWFQMGEFEIDSITTPRSEAGRTKNIVARPKAIKRLSQWKSDASYDYWSQDARVTTAGDMSYNVRVSNFSGTSVNGVLPTDHDKPSLLYSTCRPGTSYISRVRLNIQDGRDIYAGPMVSVYTETKAQAAARLGIEVDAVEGAMVKTTGILLMYTNDGTPGWRTYLVDSSQTWSTNGIAGCPYALVGGPVDCTLTPGQYDVMLIYNHGRIDGFYRAVETTDWIRAVPIDRFDLFESGDYVTPYNRSDGRGRAGYFARSEVTEEELTARAIILEVAEDAIQIGNGFNSLVNATRIFLDPPYNGVSELIPRDGTIGASVNVNPEFPGGGWNDQAHMIYHIPNQAMYASVGEGCTPQPWPHPEKDMLAALDEGQWVWATYPNDSNYQVLPSGRLEGKILEIAYQTYSDMNNQLNQKVEIVYIDTQPPSVWIPNSTYISGTFSGASGWFNLVDNEGFDHVGDPAYGHWSTGEYLIPELGGTGRYAVCGLWNRKIVRFWVRGQYYLSGALRDPGIEWVTYHHPWENPRARSFIHSATRFQHSDIFRNQTTGNGVDHPLIGHYVYGTGAGTPEATQYIAASGDQDRSFAWMAQEICRKAGVLNVSLQQEETTFVHTTADWDLAADRAISAHDRPGAAIIRYRQQASELGILGSDSDGLNGAIVTTSSHYLKLYSVANGTITLQESIPIYEGYFSDSNGSCWVTISYNSDRCSVWFNGALAGVFEVPDGVTSFSIVSPVNIGSAVIDWPMLDMRVDNFVLDINQGGLDLLRRLIKRKRIRFLDDSTGGIKLFRDGNIVGSEAAPILMSQISNTVESDLNRITRVRLEGLEVYETADEEGLTEYGNVFAVENFDELELVSQFIEEGALYLEDAERAGRSRSYAAPADPRIEPWDKVWIDAGNGAELILVKSVRFNLSISEDQAVYNMTVEGEKI